MPENQSTWVDLDALASLRDHFRVSAVARPKLFHATRVVIDPAGEPKPEPNQGWEEFLRDEPIFEAISYERPCWGVQHSCYFGAKERLTEYTGLAAGARGHLCFSLCTMSDYLRNPRFDRDSWALALYRVALLTPDDLPLDIEGFGNYASIKPEHWLRSVITGEGQDEEREKENLRAWQARVVARGCQAPRYVYATLSLDVFHASAVALQYLRDHADTLYGPRPGVVTSFPQFRREETAALTAQRTQNDDRDKWIYDKVCAGERYKLIVGELSRIAPERGWDKITSVQGVRDRAKNYAKKHGLPPPPRRQED